MDNQINYSGTPFRRLGVIANKGTQNIIREIVEKIVREYQPQKVILFGSYAYGRPTQDSDIDLLIIKETNERPIDRRVAVSQIVYDPQLRVPFEPIVLTPQELDQRLRVGDQFIQEILQKGELLYAA